jgi:hypothetical protein
LHTKDQDGYALVLSGFFGLVFFWVSVSGFLLEVTAPLWARAAFTQSVWPHVSPMVWFAVGPALTAFLAAVYLMVIWANCGRRKVLGVLAIVAGYGLALLAVYVKIKVIYANTA